MKIAFLLVSAALIVGCATSPTITTDFPQKTYYRSVHVNGQKAFYREAGNPSLPTIVLLHGYPSSSHSYRELIPLLSPYYHVIAPDNLGSGYSDHPDPDMFAYTFDKLTDHMENLLSQIGVEKYILYMQDFGAPVGFRLIVRQPEKVIAIISQNANSYLDGLTEKRQIFFRRAHDDRSKAHVATLAKWTSEEAIIQGQYLRDVPETRRAEINPDAWFHDLIFIKSEKDRKIQIQLFQDYQTNIDQYPKWQEVMRKHQFPALIAWGRNDQAFISAGATAFLRDLPNAQVELLDAGHFALEEKSVEVAKLILKFLGKN